MYQLAEVGSQIIPQAGVLDLLSNGDNHVLRDCLADSSNLLHRHGFLHRSNRLNDLWGSGHDNRHFCQFQNHLLS